MVHLAFKYMLVTAITLTSVKEIELSINDCYIHHFLPLGWLCDGEPFRVGGAKRWSIAFTPRVFFKWTVSQTDGRGLGDE